MGQSGYRAALAHADFRRLTGALIVNEAGSWAYSVVLLVWLFDQTHSTSWVAAGTVVRFLPGLLLSVYAGVIAERFERRRVLITSTMLAFVGMSAMAVCVGADAPPIVLVVLAGAVSTVCTPFNPAVAALAPQLVEEHELVAANSIQATIENVAVIAGPALGAALLATGEPVSGFAINAASFLVAGLILARLSARSTPTDVTAGGAGLFRQMSVGVTALMQSPTALAPVLVSVLATFVYGMDTVLYVPVSHHLHSGTGGYGYLLAAEAVGGVVAAGLVNRMAGQARLAWLILGGMAVYCLPLVFLPWLHSLAPALPIPVVRGAGTLFVDVLAITAMQRAVAPELLSRVFGAFETLVLGAATLGAIVMPALLSAFGLDNTLIIVGVAVPLLSLLGLPALARIDRDARARLARIEPIVELLGRLSLFANADRPVLERLASAAERRLFHPGEVLMREGDVADALYVIAEGEVTVSTLGEAGSHPLTRRIAGETFVGEIGLLHGIPRTASVTASTDCVTYRIGGDDFRDALSSTAASGPFLATARTRLARTHPVLAEGTLTEMASTP